MKCPIAHQSQYRPEALALSTLTYRALDVLIRRIAARLNAVPSLIVGHVPKGTIEDIALFFAAWRLQKVIYPVSFRLPKTEIQKRFLRVKAQPFEAIPAKWEHPSDTVDPRCLATLIETSSGEKIACHPLGAHIASARSVNSALHIDQQCRYGLILPICHVSGLAVLLRTFIAGGHLLLPQEIAHATHLSAVPTHIFRYIRDKQSFPQLKRLLVGGAFFPDNLKDAPYPILTSYGMTEAASTIAIDGKLLPHLEMKIEKKEIFIKGSSIMTGYFNKQPISTWFATGNTGAIVKGRLTIFGRLDRVFISGGEKIQPEKIEKALLAIEGIRQARVSPLEDPEFGQVPIAQIDSCIEVSIDLIHKRLKKTLPSYMIPRKIERSPMNGSKLVEMAK